MQVRRAVVPHLLQIEPLEDVQRFEHHEALRVGRTLVDVDAAVVDADRRVLDRPISGEIRLGDDSSVGLQKGRGVFRNVAAVKGIRILRNRPKGPRHILINKDVAHAERLAVLEPDLRGRRILRELLLPARKTLRQRGGDWKSLLGNLDGGREDLGERLRAVLLDRVRSAADRAGHRDRQRTIFRDAALGLVEIDRRRPRREAGAVDELHLVRLRQIDEHEHVGAEAGHAGFDLALHRPRRHRGIDGVAAGLENPHARFGGERMAGGDHPVLRRDGRPPARLPLCGEVNGTRQQGEHRDNASWLRHQFLLVRR